MNQRSRTTILALGLSLMALPALAASYNFRAPVKFYQAVTFDSGASVTSIPLTTPAITGAGTGKATLQYANSSSNRTITFPDPGGNDSVAYLGVANAFTGLNSFPTSGIVLKGTSFNDTVKALAAQGQASTLTIEDVGASTGRIYTMAAAQTAPGVLSRADMVTETGVTVGSRALLSCKNLDGTTIAGSASSGKFGISTTATFGSPASLALVTEAANSNTKTDACEVEVTLPPDYVAGSAINVVVHGNYVLGAGTVGTKSLTVDAFKMGADGTAGSNLGPAAQNLTGSDAAYTFAITPTGLVAGDKLLLQFQVVIQDTGGSNITAVINDIAVKTSVKM